jgi:hypothetical protein
MWRADVCVMVSIWSQVRVYLGSVKVQKKLLSGDLRLASAVFDCLFLV